MEWNERWLMCMNWWIDCNFVYWRYPATLLIPVVDVLTSPRRKCNIYGATTFNPRDSILTSLVLVHAGYLFCNGHSLNTNYYGTTFGGMSGSFKSSQINACVVGIGVLGPWFIVSSEGLGLSQNVAPEGIRTRASPPACQASAVPLGYSSPLI